MDLRLLTIGTEYNGRMNLHGCAIKSANLFENEFIAKHGDRIRTKVSLRGKNCTSDMIENELNKIISNLENEKVIIYYAGHGNIKGKHEYWDTPRGNVSQVKIANIFNNIPDCSSVVVFSDSCDSEHMINQLIMQKTYVSIGATRERQDASMSCDGGVFTNFLVKTLRETEQDCSLHDFWAQLNFYKVDISEFNMKVSNGGLLELPMF